MPVSICLDFGTAYSKASAWTTDTNRPIPLQIGKTIGYTGFAIPTKVAVTSNGFVYFGEEADNQGEGGNTRVIGDLKRYLTRQLRPLDRVLVPPEFNPTRYRLTMRHVIALYMGFLTHAATKSLQRREVTRRTLTMPVFRGEQQQHVKRELGFAARFGWDARDKVEDAWESGLDLRTALRLLRDFERRKPTKVDPTFLELAEPLAAFAVRMATYDPSRETRRLGMVVDIGAGTVDFGMFASGLRGEHIGVHPVANAKYSLPVGGNDIDRALTAYILDKAQLNGRRRTEVAARLGEERVRVMKENFFDGYPGYEEPVAEANIYVRKEDFLDSDHWNAFVQKVSVEFRNRLAAVHGSWLELASSLTRPNDKIDVFLSGGGARLPFLREMIPPAAPQSINNSPLFFVKVASDAPQWTTERGYAQAWRQVESDYPQLAVSLGGAVFGAGVNEHLAMHQELNQWSGAIRR